MRVCPECHEEVKYGDGGWGGDSIHARCRGKRASRTAMEKAAEAGRLHGSTRRSGVKHGENRGGW